MNRQLPTCKYGAQCYRRNPAHLAQFSHPDPVKRAADTDDIETPSAKRACMVDSSVSSEAQASSTASQPAASVTPPSASASTAAASLPSSQELCEDSERPESDVSADQQDLAQCPVYTPGDKQSRKDVDAWLQATYGVPFPDDFFLLWDFCCSLDSTNPRESLKKLLGVTLVGPYDFLAGAFACLSTPLKKSVHLHWRYYFDSPEVLTVLASQQDDGQHWGYFRDCPDDLPAFVVECTATAGHMRPSAQTVLATVLGCLGNTLSKEKESSKVVDLKKLQKDLERFAAQHQCSMRVKNVGQARDRKVNARTFNRVGIVVPYDKKQDIGYRPLSLTDGKLRRLLDNLASSKTTQERDKYADELQEIVTCVQFANDECDYGMGLELAMDLFAHGSHHLHGLLGHLLPTAYELLHRDLFAKIIHIHLARRSRSKQPSII